MVEQGFSKINLSQRERKLLTSLRIKKYRDQFSMFIAEGEKVIESLLPCFEVEFLVINASIEPPYPAFTQHIEADKIRLVHSKQMRELSEMESRQDYIAILRKKQSPTLPDKFDSICVGLEELQNPGNMGTLIRLCDWLGIKSILCSKGCVDVYSPKVVQATAGALGNVDVYQELDLNVLLPNHFETIIGTTLSGADYFDYSLPNRSTIFLFGNEGNGLSEELLSICHTALSIHPSPTTLSESLNVSLSAAIILSHFNQK